MTNGSLNGFTADSLKFLRNLKRHNDRAWFQPRKEQFENVVRLPMLQLCERINEGLIRFAPDYVSEPSKAVFRIYRDTRFSNNKAPYKTHVAAVFSHRTMPRNYGAGFYFQVSTEKTGIGGGIYRPQPELLKRLRSHIAARHETYQNVMNRIRRKKIAGEFEGEPISRVPKGWSPDHEAAELLKCRSFFFYSVNDPEAALDAGFAKEIIRRFEVIAPFVKLLDEPLTGTRSGQFDPALVR